MPTVQKSFSIKRPVHMVCPRARERVVAILSDNWVIPPEDHDWPWWPVTWLMLKTLEGLASLILHSFISKSHLKGLREEQAVENKPPCQLNQLSLWRPWGSEWSQGERFQPGLEEGSEPMTQWLEHFQESIFVSDKTRNNDPLREPTS